MSQMRALSLFTLAAFFIGNAQAQAQPVGIESPLTFIPVVSEPSMSGTGTSPQSLPSASQIIVSNPPRQESRSALQPEALLLPSSAAQPIPTIQPGPLPSPTSVPLTPQSVPQPATSITPSPNHIAPAQATHTPINRIELPEDLPRLATIDLTAPTDDLLTRLRNGFSMPNLESPLVAERLAWYLNRPDQVREMLDRSRRYMHHIVTELEKRGMPMELALLPMVESAFNPMAQSPAQASGLWQFIPSTGRNYNLAQNFWVDQRRDIVASTSAALDYLQTIYEMHGDWHLALASYNWGENAVARAVQKNLAAGLPADYSSLSMPNETRYYVPKLQALKNIIARPQLFGIALPSIPNRPYFATVETRGSMDIATAARLANMSMAEFVALNPSYNRPLMPHSGGGSILIPAQNVDKYLANLDAHDKPLSNWSTYTANRADRIETVASRFNIAPTRLRQINGMSARSRLTAGQTLLVPTQGAIDPTPPPSVADKPPSAAPRQAARTKAPPRAKATVKYGRSVAKRKTAPRQARATQPARSQAKSRPNTPVAKRNNSRSS